MAYALTKKENNKYNKYNGLRVLIFKDNLINLNNRHPRSWASRYDAKPLSFLVLASMLIKNLLLMLFKVVIVV